MNVMLPIIEQILLQELDQNVTTKLNIILKNPVFGNLDDFCNIKAQVSKSLN